MWPINVLQSLVLLKCTQREMNEKLCLKEQRKSYALTDSKKQIEDKMKHRVGLFAQEGIQ